MRDVASTRRRALWCAFAGLVLAAGCASKAARPASSHTLLVLLVRPVSAGERAGQCPRDPGAPLFVTNGGAGRLAQPQADPPKSVGNVACSWLYRARVPDRGLYAVVDRRLRNGSALLTRAELDGMAWFLQLELKPTAVASG